MGSHEFLIRPETTCLTPLHKSPIKMQKLKKISDHSLEIELRGQDGGAEANEAKNLGIPTINNGEWEFSTMTTQAAQIRQGNRSISKRKTMPPSAQKQTKIHLLANGTISSRK